MMSHYTTSDGAFPRSNIPAITETLTSDYVSKGCAHEVAVRSLCPEPPKGLITTCRLPHINLVRSHVPLEAPPFRVQRGANHNHYAVAQNQVFLIGACRSGGLSFSDDNVSIKIEPGDVFIYENKNPYVMDISSGFEALWVRIEHPTPLLNKFLLRDVARQKIDNNGGMVRIFAQTLTAIFDHSRTITRDSLKLLENGFLEMIVATLNDRTYETGEHRMTMHSLSILQRAKSVILNRLADESLNLPSIATDVGISSRRLQELFNQYGTTVGTWIMKERLDRCYRRLMMNTAFREPISRIAYEFGFKNISHFNRAFKAQFGASPRQILNQAASRETLAERRSRDVPPGDHQ